MARNERTEVSRVPTVPAKATPPQQQQQRCTTWDGMGKFFLFYRPGTGMYCTTGVYMEYSCDPACTYPASVQPTNHPLNGGGCLLICVAPRPPLFIDLSRSLVTPPPAPPWSCRTPPPPSPQQEFLYAGGDPNMRDSTYLSPLHNAAIGGSPVSALHTCHTRGGACHAYCSPKQDIPRTSSIRVRCAGKSKNKCTFLGCLFFCVLFFLHLGLIPS